ncbi:flagellar filament capping protein FliD [Desulfovibrio ferrophilus]|uniref:Flagellar hook-associated protein 2 n=1 Tax=Desulfovibrio ferrophilus TaxID=241368 RepID=A0A2Z6AWY5_9BACT|nr:flagellar filament capping protein FliD [Desulfovibrio ferrophilus]BBD07666.1 flagellar hook-associated 2 domain protein [Desulfovibrio ferrophilus]
MADYTSGAIYFTGLGNGTDFDSIIEATVEAESVRLNQLTEWEEYWQEKSDSLEELNTALVSMRSSLESMDTVTEFAEKSASSSDTSVLSATADGDAVDASHTIEINQLAQNDIWTNTTTGHSDSADSITSTDAVFAFSYAGEEYSLDVSAGTSLSELVDMINANPDSKSDVRATMINDGSEYHLQLYGMDMGEDNTVAITANTTLAGYDAADFENTQIAQSAEIKVDGYPTGADEWITRDTNTISDVLDGVTLSLANVGITTLNVTTDTDAIKDKIVEFVESVNEIRLLIQELTYVDDDAAGSVMTGNYGVDIVKQNLQNITASKGLGFSYYDSDSGIGDYYSTLSQLGISTDADESSETYGQLLIDEDELDDALETDSDAVIDLFAASEEGSSDSSDMTYVSSVDGLTSPGDHDVVYEISGGVIISATINGESCTIDGNTITGDYGTDASGMEVRANTMVDGVYTGTVSVKQGKIGEMADEMTRLTDSESGILVIIQENYDDIVANTQESIETEEDRLALFEDRLRERYAALEETLSEYDSIDATLDTLINSLTSFSS